MRYVLYSNANISLQVLSICLYNAQKYRIYENERRIALAYTTGVATHLVALPYVGYSSSMELDSHSVR